jgi:hypothetical protein
MGSLKCECAASARNNYVYSKVEFSLYRFNQQFVWQFMVYRIVDLHKNLGIYFSMIIDSKNIMKTCSFLIKQEYFLAKKKKTFYQVYLLAVSCILVLLHASFPGHIPRAVLQTSILPMKSLHNVTPFHIP